MKSVVWFIDFQNELYFVLFELVYYSSVTQPYYYEPMIKRRSSQNWYSRGTVCNLILKIDDFGIICMTIVIINDAN